MSNQVGAMGANRLTLDQTGNKYRGGTSSSDATFYPQKRPYTFFFYKQRVYKHTQPQIREILSTLLSTSPASDFEIDIKISEKLLLLPKF